MTHGKKHLLILSLVASFALTAQAQNPRGYGPGMMGGGYGPGMMGGSYGPGMMGGGYGPGMMGGWAYSGIETLDLTAQQRSKINQIQDDLRKRNWAVMGQMMDEQARMRDLTSADKPDAAAIGELSIKISDLQKQMQKSMVDAHIKIDAVLTKEQKAQLRKWGND